MKLDGATVLCTGGNGFVGRHLCSRLVKMCRKVIVLDDLSTSEYPVSKDVTFIEAGVGRLQAIRAACRGVDVIFHLAALPSVPRSIQYPVRAHQVNAGGTLNVLIAAVDCGVKRVVYSSSSSVYGDTPVLPKTEDMLPNPASPYAASKLAGEHYCQAFHKVHGLSAVSLRYFNVYGLGQRADSPYSAAIPKFIAAIRRGDPVTIYGDGQQTRDFTFVEDVVDANILAAESDACGICNVGSGQPHSIRTVAEIVNGLVGRDFLRIEQQPKRAGDIRDSWANINKARKIGYSPKWTLADGLRRTVCGD